MAGGDGDPAASRLPRSLQCVWLGWHCRRMGAGTGTRCGAGGSGAAKPTPEPPGRLFPREETRALPGAVAVLSPSCAVSLLAGFSVIDRLASGIFTPPSISGFSASI